MNASMEKSSNGLSVHLSHRLLMRKKQPPIPLGNFCPRDICYRNTTDGQAGWRLHERILRPTNSSARAHLYILDSYLPLLRNSKIWTNESRGSHTESYMRSKS